MWIFDNISKTAGAKILEIGCGNGILWKLNIDRVPSDWDITLTDFSEGMLKDAENMIGECTADIKYRVMNVEDIPYSDESFDIVFANHMLYHVNDRKKGLMEIRRVLKNGGIFYASTMEKNYMGELSDIIREFRSVPKTGKRTNIVIENFSIENGGEQLEEFFRNVDLKLYENMLIITEAEPFTDYAVSLNNITPGRFVLDESEKTVFSEFVQSLINRDTSIDISANAGVFICRK